MKWANFLHIYQPADQQPDILEAIVVQSYRPIIEGIKRNPRVRLTLNVSGTLWELFDKYGYNDLIDSLRALGTAGRVEFTGSAKYHAFFPFLKEEEIWRQIEINNQTNIFFLGKAYHPRGFFPPEMAYKENLIPILENLGFHWVILDEIANGEIETLDYSKIYQIRASKLKVFFRERRPSNLIMSAVTRSAASLKESLKKEMTSERYLITAMDGETFGHHRPGLEKMLFEIFSSTDFELVTISDLLNHYQQIVEVEPRASTWASSADDIQKGTQFLSWSDPENILHQWQQELTDLVLQEVYNLDSSDPAFPAVRQMMDKALASDHFWWASAKPWWSLEMIEAGAYRLLETIRLIPQVYEEKLHKASDYYEKIISTSFQWQRSGKIRAMIKEQQQVVRLPFKDRATVGPGSEEAGVYNAFVAMMRNLEKKSAAHGEYEKAILWRDAVYKLEQRSDIYDAVSAIDLVRLEIPYEKVEKIISEYKEKARRIRSGQPEQRG